MGKLRILRKGKGDSVGTNPHGKLSMLRRKLKLRTGKTVHDETAEDEAEMDHQNKKLFQRASPMKLVRLYPFMTEKQVELVRRAEFGGLLDIKCSMLQPKLCKYLMEHFNAVTCEFVFPDRGSIPVTEDSVYIVLGVPWGNKDVRYEMDSDAIKFMMEEFDHHGSNQPTMSSLEKKLKAMKSADNTYLRLWTVYALCSVVAPTTGIHVSPRIYPSLVDIKNAKDLNVCKFVIKILCKAAKARVEKGILKACMLFCMIKYLDSLELEGIDISNSGTRVAVWTNAMVKKAISQDMNYDGTFGRAKLKAEFKEFANRGSISPETTHMSNNEEETPQCSASQNTHDDTRGSVPQKHEEEEAHLGILFPDPKVFTEFVERNTPRMYLSDHQERFTVAVEEACCLFEKGLQQMFTAMLKQPVNEKWQERKRQRIPVVKKKIKLSRNIREQETMTPSCENSDYSNASDEDYEPDEDKVEMVDTPVSLDDESFDITRSCSTQSTKVEVARRRKRRRKASLLSQASVQEPQNSDFVPPATDGAKTRVATPPTSPAVRLDHGANSDLPNTEDTPANSATVVLDEGTNGNLHSSEKTLSNSPLARVDHGSGEVKQGECNDSKKVEETENEGEPISHSNFCPPEKKVEETESTTGTTNSQAEHLNRRNSQGNMDHHLDAAETLAKICETYMTSSTTVSNSDIIERFEKDQIDSMTEGTSKASLLDFVKYSPAKFQIPLFETPVFFDFERPTDRAFQSIIAGLKPMDHKDADKLQSVVTRSATKELNSLLSEIETSATSNKRKTVSFANQPELKKNKSTSTTNSPGKYRTRSVVQLEGAESPSKECNIKRKESPRRTVLLRSTKVPANTAETVKTEMSKSPAKQCNLQRRQSPRRKVQDPVNTTTVGDGMIESHSKIRQSPRRTLLEKNMPEHEHGSQVTANTPLPGINVASSCNLVQQQNNSSPALQDSMVRRLNFNSSESEKRKRQLDSAPDAPSFDLGFDTQLDDEEGRENKENQGNGSITPVPREYNKRLVKAAKFEKSPYVAGTKKNFTVNRAINEIYNMVLKHGPNSNSERRGERIINVGDYFINLSDLADSVAPKEQLINMTAELGIYIINAENKNPKKFIMPLRISKYLIEYRFELKDVKRVFSMSPTHRLDHKEIICFPTLRTFNNAYNTRNRMSTGHYFLVNLNLKAERFEIMDSIVKGNGEPLMMEDCHLLVAAIKTLWKTEYKSSRIDISNYPIDIIPCPKQTNSYDCGFFMLQLLEDWHGGRRVEWFEQNDMPNIRKLCCEKWIRWHENVIQWQLVL